MAKSKPSEERPKVPARTSTGNAPEGLSAEERAAMRERARELIGVNPVAASAAPFVVDFEVAGSAASRHRAYTTLALDIKRGLTRRGPVPTLDSGLDPR